MPRPATVVRLAAAVAVPVVLALSAIAAAPAAAVGAPTRATAPVGASCPAPAVTPALTGTFIDPNQAAATTTAAAAAELVDRLCATGITEIVLQQTADLDARTLSYPPSASSPAGYRQLGPDVVALWSTALARHPGMHLHLGLGLSPSWFAASGSLSAADFADWLAPRRDADVAIARDITQRYAGSVAFRSTFTGWYLPDEVDAENFLTPGSTTVDPRATVVGRVLLGPLTAALHTLTPRATVSTAPFYQADVFTPPAWTALWRTVLDAAVATSGPAGAVDVIAPQDGLGLGGGTATSADLPAWFAATASAISASRAAGRTALWDDVETYRLDGDPHSHPATAGDLVQAMTAAGSRTAIGRYVAFTYAADQLGDPAVDAAYRAYVTGNADRTPPTAPRAVAIGARPDRTSVTVRWTPASDVGSGVAGYLLFRDGAYARRIDDPSATSVTDTELAPGTHRWQVAAFDGAGNESARPSTAPTTVTAPVGTNVAAGARYWFPAALPNSSYSDGCRSAAARTACAGSLTVVRARTDTPSRTYPQTFQGYTGTIGDTTVVVDLGRARNLTDVTSHWLSQRSSAVRGPSTVTVATSTDGVAWTTVATAAQPARPVDSGFWPHYVSADRQTFATTYSATVSSVARYVRITGVNPLGTVGWTMTDGLAVYGS